MEKGLSYFDLAENDYQFLLKDKKEGRVEILCVPPHKIFARDI